MYRKKDLQNLQDIFNRTSNDIVLLYGKRDMGLADIVSDFIKDKECLYYKASAVTDRVQKQLFASSLYDQTKNPIFPDDDYGNLINTFINNQEGRKKIIVLDDFIYLVKGNPTFINFLSNLLFAQNAPNSAMFLLVCDDIRWVEQEMVGLVGKKSSEISAVVKLNEYSATEFYNCFPDMPLSESIGIYSLTGGRSSYYDMIESDTTFHELVIRMLDTWADTDIYPLRYLPHEIREPAVYNTILMNIASGVSKLNDIHKATDIDRAKLSVYLKTLIENDLVEKAVSADVGDPSNTKKAMYRIRNRMVLFYYRFVFPHLSALTLIGPERFYKRFIEHSISEFLEDSYHLVCMEHIRWLESEGRLNFKVAGIEEYFDKNEAIDFVIVAVGGSVIACSCRYSGSHMSYKTFEAVKTSVRRNKMHCDNIWLFSASGFDQKLTMSESVTPGLKLINGKDQRLR